MTLLASTDSWTIHCPDPECRLEPTESAERSVGYSRKRSMQEFLVADLNAKGELQLQEMYSYALLERIPGASELIARLSGALWREPSMFEIPLTDAPARIMLRWAATADSAGIATIRQDQALMSLSLLACGMDSDAD